MAVIKFTRALKRFYPDLQPLQMRADNIAEIIAQLDEKYPGLSDYIVNERGILRQHVNIFIENQLIKDREQLTDVVREEDEVYIMQALSGG